MWKNEPLFKRLESERKEPILDLRGKMKQKKYNEISNEILVFNIGWIDFPKFSDVFLSNLLNESLNYGNQ